MSEQLATRRKDRTYIGLNGREVYYRFALRTVRQQGSPGCGPEGWTCAYCARIELDCICKPAAASDRPDNPRSNYDEEPARGFAAKVGFGDHFGIRPETFVSRSRKLDL